MVVFDEVDTETLSLKLLTTTSVKLEKFQPAAESDTNSISKSHYIFSCDLN